MKKLLSILLAVVLLVSVCPFGLFTFSASAEETATSGTTGDCTWTFDGSVLTISGNGEMADYTPSSETPFEKGRIAMPWRDLSISEVVIEEGVTEVGDFSFYGLTSITKISFPDSMLRIGNYAFYYCGSFESVTIPENVEEIGANSFGMTAVSELNFNAKSCYSPTYEWFFMMDCGCCYDSRFIDGIGWAVDSLNIGKNVEIICGYAFRFCSLKSVVIPDSVTSIGGYAFSDCDSLTSITIPDSVTSIGSYVFAYCDSLTSITIPDSVTSIGDDAFYNTAYYNNSNNWENDVLYIGKHLIKAKTSISGTYSVKQGTLTIAINAFYNCDSITSVTIGNSVTSIGNYAFRGCSSLTSVTIGNGVTSIGYYAFYNTAYYNNSSNWENGVLYIGKHLIDAKETISGAYTIKQGTLTIAGRTFSGCDSLTSITIPDSVTSIGNYAFEYCSSLTSITIPASVTSIGDDAFRGCPSLESITVGMNNKTYHSDSNCLIETATKTLVLGCKNSVIPTDGNVTSIGSYAFYGCSSLTSITIPNSVTSIGNYAFRGCSSLTSVTIGNSVTSIGSSAFYNCKSLTSVTIPDSVTSIGGYAFEECTSLTSITIPDSVTSIGSYAFYNCDALTYVYYGGTLENKQGMTIGLRNDRLNNATWYFNCCSLQYSYNDADSTATVIGCDKKVVDIGVPPTVIKDGKTYTVTAIDSYAFYGYMQLETVTLPDSVTKIGAYAFTYCEKLKNINLGNGVKTISMAAFYGCIALENIVLPDSVTGIGSYLFTKCSSLKTVSFGKKLTEITTSAFYGCSSIESVTFAADIKSIAYYAFYGCNALTDVYYNNTEIAKNKIAINSTNAVLLNATWHCVDAGYLSYILNDSNMTATVTGGDKTATTLTIPDTVTINGKTYKVTTIDTYAFCYYESLENIVIGDNVNAIGMSAFYGCSELTSVTFGAKVKYIGSYVFSKCSKLSSLVLPDTVTSLGNYAFVDCSSMKTATISNQLTKIGNSSFYGCSGLTTITIGANMKTVEYYAFVGCNALTDVYFNGTEAQKARIAINSSNSKLKNATWHCNG